MHELRSGGLSTVDLGEAISKFGKDLLSSAAMKRFPSLVCRLKEHRGPSIP